MRAHCSHVACNAAAAYHRTPGAEAEVFWQLSVGAYCRLHRPTLPEEARAFQGVWHLPFKDPVAYASGLARRRQLRELA